MPSSFVELGWTRYVKENPPLNEAIKTVIVPNNRHPIWN